MSASRAEVLIDGEAYFRAFTRAALRATRSIVIVGWDFHSRTVLHAGLPGVPDLLGEFLNYLARRRRALHINILIWNSPLLFSRGREPSPAFGLGWRPHRRVHFKYDNLGPVESALHQKFVVIDGAVAFCGGMDLTQGRWDTQRHEPSDHSRRNAGEENIYEPFHDAMLVVEGELAQEFHELARESWRLVTGRRLPALAPRRIDAGAGERAADIDATGRMIPVDVWPEGLPATFRQVRAALARTVPPSDECEPVREIEQLYLDMIARARKYIYLENQYFTAGALGDALASRLREPDGPEVIAVLRFSTAAWVEASTMGVLRTELLRKLRAADRFGKFCACYPSIPGLDQRSCCDVHTKLMIVDDEWLRLGSANFANRSMWLDRECDVVLEAQGDASTREAIAHVRNRFLSEHLGVTPEVVAEKLLQLGSLRAVIDELSCPGQRSLRRFEKLDDVAEALLTAACVADPERPTASPSKPHAGRVSSGVRALHTLRTKVRIVGTLVAAGSRRFFRSPGNPYGTGRP